VAQITKPTDIGKIWASGGVKATPLDSKINTGWVIEVPPYQWFNWFQNRNDRSINHINQHGICVWDGVTEYQANKSYVQGATNGLVYKALTTHTNINPESDGGTNWVRAFADFGSGISETAADAKYLAKTQNLNDLPSKSTARTNLGVYSTTQVDNLVSDSSPDIYQSSNQTITNAGAITLSHGLGDEPDALTTKLICISDDLGYTTGHVVLLNPGVSSTNTSTGIGIRLTTTQIIVRYGSAGIQIVNGITGSIANITNANWRLVVKAIKF
tara:strand:+ start:41265 stop:42077 length:813 start_codon:yes stop_codon:yes gene_type:complete